MGLDFIIEYNPGKNKKAADALSRIFETTVEISSLLSVCGIEWKWLQEEVKIDATLTRIRKAVLFGNQVPNGYTVENDVLYKGRYVLAKSSPFIPVLLCGSITILRWGDMLVNSKPT